MINYIVKYQNNWVYSKLFHRNMIPLIMKGGVKLEPLFRSDVIIHPYDTPEWPSAHKDTTVRLNPYSGSLFKLRSKYREVFPVQSKLDDADQKKNRKEIEDAEKLGRSFEEIEMIKFKQFEKIYKIKYEVNMLLSMDQMYQQDGENETSLLDALIQSDEIELFDTPAVKDIIDYKWDKYAGFSQGVLAFLHFTYAIVLLMYIKITFIIS